MPRELEHNSNVSWDTLRRTLMVHQCLHYELMFSHVNARWASANVVRTIMLLGSQTAAQIACRAQLRSSEVLWLISCLASRRRGFERYLRKMAKLPQWPALLYLHTWQPDYMGPAFWHGAEMQIDTILQYYGVPSVSARNALWHLSTRNVTGFKDEEIFCGVHPNPLGHR